MMQMYRNGKPLRRYAVTFPEAEACQRAGLPVAFNGHITAVVTCTEAELTRALKAEREAAWEALKAMTTPEELAAAYRDLNVRDDG
jgi:hypothetical protein